MFSGGTDEIGDSELFLTQVTMRCTSISSRQPSRKHTRTGHQFGTERFIKELEATTESRNILEENVDFTLALYSEPIISFGYLPYADALTG